MAADSVRQLGFDPDRLTWLSTAIQRDIETERYDGCELIVGRHGQIAYHQQFGWADRAAGRRVDAGQPFVSMSIGKQFVVALVLNRIERGDLALTTPVADVIPEFGARGKSRITIAHMLTHTAGMPAMLPPMPLELVANLEAMVTAACGLLAECLPGERVSYSAIVAHAVLAEVVRRLDGSRRSFRQLAAEDLFEPLGMTHTALGLRADLAARLAPVVARDRRRGFSNPRCSR